MRLSYSIYSELFLGTWGPVEPSQVRDHSTRVTIDYKTYALLSLWHRRILPDRILSRIVFATPNDLEHYISPESLPQGM